MAIRSLALLVLSPLLLHTETQNPSLQSALAVRQVAQKLRCGCKVVRLGFIGICREEFEFAARTAAAVGFPENGFPEKCTGEKDCREEPADEDVEEARVAGLPTLILLLLLLLEEAVLVLMLPPSSSALLAGSSEDLNGDKIIISVVLSTTRSYSGAGFIRRWRYLKGSLLRFVQGSYQVLL